MTDWREDAIAAEEFNDGFGYRIKYDEWPEYDRTFAIYATSGTQRYLPVDVVIDPDDEEHFNMEMQNVAYKLPLYLFAHSGVSISVAPFNDPWDSGQCGYAVITKEQAAEMAPSHDDAVWDQILRDMVKEYDAYLRGSIVYWIVYRKNICDCCHNVSEDIVESCGGYIMTDYSRLDEIINDDILTTIEAHRNAMKEAEHGSNAVLVGND